MKVRFLLGAAGTGKTHACVAGARAALVRGGPGRLLFLAPKQATFQVERQVLAEDAVGGFSRLSILSFERLAQRVLEDSGQARDLLGEEGRTMVLRALLEREAPALRHFGKVARSAGLARELSGMLRRFQEHGLDAGRMESLAAREALPGGLRAKLWDGARLLRGWKAWLDEAGLDDPSERAWRAIDILQRDGTDTPRWEATWMDGFAEMTSAEVSLLASVARRSDEVTVAFCLDRAAASSGRAPLWRVVEDTFHACHAALSALGGAEVEVVDLGRDPGRARFVAGGALDVLERRAGAAAEGALPVAGDPGVRVVRCRNPHEEAEVVARLVIDAVAQGARYRDVAVLMRSLEEHGPLLERTFRRVGIPCFVDRRHPLRHHPLVELMRTALRVASDPASEQDWFAWLKCGLLPLEGWDAEALENRLMASRWEGRRWMWTGAGAGDDGGGHDPVRMRVMGPLRGFVQALAAPGGLDGGGLARATRALWAELGVEARLESWDGEGDGALRHGTVFREVSAWLDEAARAFRGHPMEASQWLPVVESAWGGLTAGAVPPTLDQVLIGAVDRSRNPDLEWVVLPGWVEGGFPAAAPTTGLLSGSEVEALETVAGVGLGPTPLDRVHHEHFYGYVALTRARRGVVVTWAAEGLGGKTTVASPLIRRWLAEVPMETGAAVLEPGARRLAPETRTSWEANGRERLGPAVAEAFWRGRIETSASALETMASCRFQFFARQVLRLRERDDKVADARKEGSWAHGLLAAFHHELRREGRSWRSLTPSEGLERLGRVAAALRRAEGVDHAGSTVEFAWGRAERQVAEWLRHWLAVLPDWPGEPEWVEAAFGGSPDEGGDGGTVWGVVEWPMPGGGALALRGRVDRVDVLGTDPQGRPRLWVEDYKRGRPTFKPDRVKWGFDLQLPLYLEVARRATGGVPAGMTYAALRADQTRGRHRDEPVESAAHAHRGRFDWALVQEAAGRPPDWARLPFVAKFKKDGTPMARSDGVGRAQLLEVIDTAVQRAVELAAGMVSGDVAVAPVADGKELPCDLCAYRGVCRVGAGVDLRE